MNPTGYWRLCCPSEGLMEDRLQEFDLGEKRICLLRRAGRVLAFSANCPHAGGRLCEGWIDARGRVVCPVHHYRFDPANGYNASGEGYKLKTFPAKDVEGSIFVFF
ncbi:MAG: Rieske 2Fe-2S domain-containing protein [Bacteroidetes bacterium]|nr:Rieske 2Fe-2S domain-containing protein [Bacteroidota bacterium]